MIIKTTRFGQVEIQDVDVIQFTEGILGFSEQKKFVLIDDPTDEIFVWLQSCEEPGIAFPVLEPELFAESYNVTLAKTDLESLKLPDLKKARLYCIVTIPDDPTQMTANMKAPVVVNVALRSARQCVLQDNNLAIREPIFAKLQQRMVTNPTQPVKRSAIDAAPAVRISGNRAADTNL